ncbi:MAG: L-threonylcarbamoyladenylate synthase [Candidatus Saccharibacteria bacterium]
MPKRRSIPEVPLKRAVEVLVNGGIVVFPTDTSYGLAVDATNLTAIRRLYRLKGRGFDKPIHVIPPSRAYVGRVAIAGAAACKLMASFWPGPLTLVLPLRAADPALSKIKGSRGLGFRWPDHPIAQALARKLKKPVTATSANVSGRPDAYSVGEVLRQFRGRRLKPDFYLDGGVLKKVIPSTIVYLDRNRVTILRKGPVSERAIKKTLRK